MEPAADYQAYLEKYRTRNFTTNFFTMAFYNLGLSFVFPATVLTLYASYLTDSAAMIGIIPAFYLAGMNFPQLFFARRAELLPKKRPLILKLAFCERIPYLIIALSIFLFPDLPRNVSFLILMFGIAVATFSGGMLQPVWRSMITKLIDQKRRGLLFGLGFGIGGIFGALGALGSRTILDVLTYPQSFALCFLCAFIAHCGSLFLLASNKEPSKAPTKAVPPIKEYFKNLPVILKTDRNFFKYLFSQIFVVFGLMGINFYILYAKKTFEIDTAFVANMTIASLLGQTLGNPLLGVIADKWGNKLMGTVTIVISAVVIVILLTAQSHLWLYLVFSLMQLGMNGTNISRMAITMEFSSPDKVPTYTGLSGTFFGPALLLAPIAAGWIIDSTGYTSLFYVILLFQLAGFIVLTFFVKEPRKIKPLF